MKKRKKFEISDDVNRGIEEVINAVNNNAGSFRYEVVSLSRIEVDPYNPRELALTDKDIKFGIDANDSQVIKKRKEKEELESLAYTLKHSGIINPIVIYKHEGKYRIIAGERRFLASILAGKTDIHARIIDKRPNETDLKVLQWIENNERKDLSLNERLKNLEAIIEAYSENKNNEPMTGDVLKKLTGLSKTQAYYYLSIIKGPMDLKRNIEEGVINNLDKAALIAGISDQSLREEVILSCVNGSTIKSLKEIISKDKNRNKKNLISGPIRKSGAMAQYVNLGRTKNVEAVKKIVEIVISHPHYNQHIHQFDAINWKEYKSISVAFQNLLSILGN